MVGPLTIYFVRHGEVHNPQNILYGRMPGFHLSDIGRGQASAAAHALQDSVLNAVYSSPMERAQETARIIAASHLNIAEHSVDERLNEVYTPYDGTPQAELEKTLFDLYSGTQPPYEQPADIRRRLSDWMWAMRKKHSGAAIAAVTHGDIVVSAFLIAMQYTPNDMARTQLEELGLSERYPATASISRLSYHSAADDEVPQYFYTRPY